ncbi:MAG: DUF5110 domain-containing protein [Opitutales bacterium]|nr:DUF5110 domain-containing protein [Opitutales bacterium]
MNPLSHPKSTVSFGQARFTVLTSRLVRLEWAEDSHFEDLATLTVANRRTDPVRFKVQKTDRKIEIETEHLTLRYTEDGKPFHRKNLEIRFTLNGRPVRWFPGKKDPKNLKGTAETLDNANGRYKATWKPVEEADPALPILSSNPSKTKVFQGEFNEEINLGEGLLSRSGWAVVDDSHSCVLDPELCHWQPWPRERPSGERRDWYFLGYGWDFKDALREASRIFGQQPLPPRYALGYWYSRYWAYTDQELMQLVEDFDKADLPLDILVIDMDWHKLGWTGYSWDPDYFPDYRRFLQWLKKRGLKITLNLHPADGVFDFEDAFPEMLKAMGIRKKDLPDLEPEFHPLYKLLGKDPQKAKRIPLTINDPKYMQAYFTCLHHPLEEAGVDFWWMDWQQGRTGSQLPNLNPLPWINELHWQDQKRRTPNRRPINFSRYGGLGAGRMPVGFSGDTLVCWESLAFQPYFTATANNVLYGYWSHDIGGHMGGELTPELYTRWLQFGVFSPILRTHTSKNINADRRVFYFPDPYRRIMMRDLQRRYELIPYLYREMAKGTDSGLSLLRPMYVEYPEDKAAYSCPDQYFFGDEMIVAPVISPADPKSETTQVGFWLPPGSWYDTARGVFLEGGKKHRARYTLSEVPVFVRPGTVIPEQKATRRLREGSYPEPVFRIYPGDTGAGTLYEDDGISNGYQEGNWVGLTLSHQRSGNQRTLRLEMTHGRKDKKFKGFRKKRRIRILMEGFAPPVDVQGAAWSYDGNTATLALDLGEQDLTRPQEIVIQEPKKQVTKLSQGLKGLLTRLERIRQLNCQVSPPRPVHTGERFAVRLAQTGRRITLEPDNFSRQVQALHRDLPKLSPTLRAYATAFQKKKANPDGSCPQAEILRQAAAMANTLKAIPYQ